MQDKNWMEGRKGTKKGKGTNWRAQSKGRADGARPKEVIENCGHQAVCNVKVSGQDAASSQNITMIEGLYFHDIKKGKV